VSLILPWVLFPLVLAAIGAGWGILVELAAGARVNNALVVPLGLAAAIVVAGILTAFSGTARAATPVVAVGAVAGLVVWARARLLARRAPAGEGELAGAGSAGVRRSPLPGRWALLAALGAFLIYGAPVLLSGEATFTGFLKLDDTGTWFNVVDIVMNHSHSLAALNAAFHPPSTFTQVFTGDVGEQYPLGAFMLLGVGNQLTGIDPAWIIQAYFACCAAALALGIFALTEPLVSSPRLRALVAFFGAQPALLYGYSLWGGIKEMTAAFLLVMGIALAAPLLRRPPARFSDARALLPLVVTAAALIQVLQVGGGGWALPVLVILAAAWIWQGWRLGRLRVSLASLGGMAAVTAVLVLPVWLVLSDFLNKGYKGLLSEGQTHAEKFGNLLQPISGWQLAGIWPVGDFRFTAPAWPTVLFIAVVVIMAVVGIGLGARRRQYGLALYVIAALFACGLLYLDKGTAWVIGKSLSISSPAILTAALTGAAMLWGSRPTGLPRLAGGAQTSPEAAPAEPEEHTRAGPAPGSRMARARRHLWMLGPLTILIIGGGVLWSNVLAYSDTTIAPHGRMVELQHIGRLVAGKGPTFVNFYEAYADRHFLRAGAPVEPAEYRPVTLPTRSGAVLTKSAWANLDAFPLSTLLPYRSIVTMRSPVESRPPSIYSLVWKGTYYELWQRPEPAPETIIEHIPYGEPNTHPYCGNSQFGASEPVCSLNPVAIPSCPQLQSFGRKARGEGAHLVAYQRAIPTFTYGDQVLWPASWLDEQASHTLTATTPGTAVGHIAIPSSQTYEMFLGGAFGRGFEVRVDGRKLGRVKDQLSGFIAYIPVGRVYLTAGVHTFEYVYPHADLTPGNGETLGSGEFAPDGRFTSLSAVLLQPLQYPPSELISVAPSEATRLCGRPLEWVELVKGGTSAP
jgi:hypothetical protein